MNVTPRITRTCAAAACTVLVLSFLSGCGDSAAERRATAVQQAADTVSRDAKRDLRDWWEHTARDRHHMILREWRRQHPASGATSSCR